MGEVWGMKKRMGGGRRESYVMTVMTSEDETVVSNRDNAEIMARSFANICSSENLSQEGRRERTTSQCPGVLDRSEDGWHNE